MEIKKFTPQFKNGKVVYVEKKVKTLPTEVIKDDFAKIMELPQYIPVKSRYKRPAYKAATDFLYQQNEKKIKGWLIVHGIVWMKKRNKWSWYIHAWCEKGNQVVDSHRKIKCSKKQYYKDHKIEESFFVYTFNEAMDLLDKKRTYGPWHEDLKEFLKEGGK